MYFRSAAESSKTEYAFIHETISEWATKLHHIGIPGEKPRSEKGCQEAMTDLGYYQHDDELAWKVHHKCSTSCL